MLVSLPDVASADVDDGDEASCVESPGSAPVGPLCGMGTWMMVAVSDCDVEVKPE